MVTSDIAGNKENRIIMMSGRCDYNSKRFYATIMLHDKGWLIPFRRTHYRSQMKL